MATGVTVTAHLSSQDRRELNEKCKASGERATQTVRRLINARVAEGGSCADLSAGGEMKNRQRLQVPMTPDERQAMRNYCAANGVKPSVLIRALVRQYLGR